MPRLGELLVAARLLTDDQVEQALRAQVMWGGRIGTALVELGFIDLDALSRALGRKHGMLAALARHFEKADPALQVRLPIDLAQKHSVVPLLRVGGGKLAIASLDRLARPVRAQIADALGLDVNDLVVAIAPEQRLRYQLERVYGIARPARFLRVHGASPVPVLGDVPVPIDSDPEVVVPIDTNVTLPVAAADREAIPEPIDAPDQDSAGAEDLAAMLERATETAPTAAHDTEPGRDRRSYVRTLVDEGPAPAATALGRIAIRKLAVESQSLPIVQEASADTPQSLSDAARAIKRAPKRDRVADLAIDALVRFVPTCDAAMLMVVRGGVAIGWRWFCRTGEPPPELAVPTGEPGLVAAAIATSQTIRTRVDQLGPVDGKLVSALGATTGDLVTVPVPIGNRVMCVIVAVVQDGASVDPLDAIAGAASAAFARLVRDASR